VAPDAPAPDALPEPETEPLWPPCELCEPCALDESLALLDVLEPPLGEVEELLLDGWFKLPLPETDDEEEPLFKLPLAEGDEIPGVVADPESDVLTEVLL